jgi:glucose-1-phosphatase
MIKKRIETPELLGHELPGIQNIIFDLGGVLLDLDFNAPVRAYHQLGGDGDRFDYKEAIHHQLFIDFEVGNITAADFRHQIRQMVGNFLLTDDEINTAWCSMLLSVPAEKVLLLKKLAEKFRLFLYSNTNEIHCAYFKKQFEKEHGISIELLFEKCFYSHEMHDRKPLLSGFEKVVRASGISAEETLFIDDFEHNIDAAREFGFRVYHYQQGSDLSLWLFTR